MKWKTLEHNGVLFPPEYNYKKISVKVKGKKTSLNKKQEEMAWAWTKKKDTTYVQDKIFIKNLNKFKNVRKSFNTKPWLFKNFSTSFASGIFS